MDKKEFERIMESGEPIIRHLKGGSSHDQVLLGYLLKSAYEAGMERAKLLDACSKLMDKQRDIMEDVNMVMQFNNFDGDIAVVLEGSTYTIKDGEPCKVTVYDIDAVTTRESKQ